MSVADKASFRAVLALLLTGLIFGLIWLTGGANAQIRAQEQSVEPPDLAIESDSTSLLPQDPPLQTPTMDESVGAPESAELATFAALAANPSVTTANSSTTTSEPEETTSTTEVAETTTTVEVTTTTHDHPTTTVEVTTTTAPTTTTSAPTTTTLAPTTTTTEPPPVTTTTTTSGYSGVLSESEARDLFGQYFSGDDVDVALRIAKCESSLNTDAYNPAGYGGLFQHSIAYWDSRSAAAGWGGASIYDGQANTAVAYWLYTQSGWSPWPNC